MEKTMPVLLEKIIGNSEMRRVITEVCRSIFEMIMKRAPEIFEGRKASTVSAVCLYLAALKCGQYIKRTDIERYFGISGTNLNKVSATVRKKLIKSDIRFVPGYKIDKNSEIR